MRKNQKYFSVVKSICLVAAIPFCIHMGNKTAPKESLASRVCTQKDQTTEKSIVNNTHNKSDITLIETESEPIQLIQFSEKTPKIVTLPSMEGDDIIIDINLSNYIYNVSNEYGVPYELTLAVCYVESRFTPRIDNAGTNTDGTTDYGLMGLNDLYLQDYCDRYNNGILIDPYNPYQNAFIGIQILADNLMYFEGNLCDAANAYNLGIAGWEEMKSYGESWYYAENIMSYMNLLKNATC